MPLSDSGNKVFQVVRTSRNPNDGSTTKQPSSNIMVSNKESHPIGVTLSSSFRGTRKRNTDRYQQRAAATLNPEESLQKLLRARNLYESAAQSELRRTVLIELEAFLQAWVDQITNSTSNHAVPNHTVHVCTFGSYRLGVHNATSDIDVLCLTPTYVTRQDFFTSLVQMLHREEDIVTDLQPVPSAFTPVIKMKWKGIAVDLVFANFSDSSPPPPPPTETTTTTIATTTFNSALLQSKDQEVTSFTAPSQQQYDTNFSAESFVSYLVIPVGKNKSLVYCCAHFPASSIISTTRTIKLSSPLIP